MSIKIKRIASREPNKNALIDKVSQIFIVVAICTLRFYLVGNRIFIASSRFFFFASPRSKSYLFQIFVLFMLALQNKMMGLFKFHIVDKIFETFKSMDFFFLKMACFQRT